jgi:hypothetical protein
MSSNPEETNNRGTRKGGIPDSDIGLVEYECGCIGWPPDEDLDALLVYHCDRDKKDPYDDGWTMLLRHMGLKSYKRLSSDKYREAILKLREATWQRRLLRQIRDTIWATLGLPPAAFAARCVNIGTQALMEDARRQEEASEDGDKQPGSG